MTNKEKIEAEEHKYHLYCLANKKCQVCGKDIFDYSQAQLAHRIPKSKLNLAKYGKEVIHHPLNMAIVCSLTCNSSVIVSPAARPVEAAKLVEKIKKEIGE